MMQNGVITAVPGLGVRGDLRRATGARSCGGGTLAIEPTPNELTFTLPSSYSTFATMARIASSPFKSRALNSLIAVPSRVQELLNRSVVCRVKANRLISFHFFNLCFLPEHTPHSFMLTAQTHIGCSDSPNFPICKNTPSRNSLLHKARTLTRGSLVTTFNV